MQLRPYQRECLASLVRFAKQGVKRQLVTIPTGTGKTVIFSQIPNLAAGKRMLVLAHRKELIDQAAESISRANPALVVDVEQANRHALPGAPVVVASVQTLAVSPRRLEALSPDQFGMVVVDESHHSVSKSYLRIFNRFGLCVDPDQVPDRAFTAKQLSRETRALFQGWGRPGKGTPYLFGFTATPHRTDGIGLEFVFDEIAYSKTIREMIAEGWLVDVRGVQIPTDTSIEAVKTRRGDYAENELAEKLNVQHRNETAVNSYLALAADRQAICFCVDVAHTEAMTEAFRDAGVKAGMVVGETPKAEREKVIAAYRRGEIQVLANCMVLTEGFDAPETSAIIMARPTKSSLMYCLDMDTEILTDRGWMPYEKLQDDDLVAGFNPFNNQIQWEQINGRVCRPILATERMLQLESPTISLRVTDTHRMVWATREGRSHKRTSWRITSAGELSQHPGTWYLPVAGYQNASGVALTDDEIRFLGWVQTDGCVNKHNKVIQIGQSLGYPDRCREIERVLTSCGFKWRYSDYTEPTNFGDRAYPQRVYRISYGSPRVEDKHLTGWKHLSKWIGKYDSDAWNLLEDITAHQLSVLLSAWHLGDGYKYSSQPWERHGYSLAIAERSIAEWVQSICVRRGWRCNIAESKGISRVYCSPRTWRSVGGCNVTDRQHWQPSDHFINEMVWCLSVPSGAFVVRRQGKAAIVGNTQMLGRGTRLAPGKKDLLVIDLVDIGAAGVSTVNTLFGLPPKLALADVSAVEALDHLEEEIGDQLAFDAPILAGALSVAEVLQRARSADPLQAAALPNWLDHRLAWVRTSYGYALDLGGGNTLGIVTNTLGQGTVRFKASRQASTSVGFGRTEQEAISLAEAYVREHYEEQYGLLNRHASWRTNDAPASQKQIDYLRWLRVDVPEGCTKGQAAMLISLAKSRKVAL